MTVPRLSWFIHRCLVLAGAVYMAAGSFTCRSNAHYADGGGESVVYANPLGSVYCLQHCLNSTACQAISYQEPTCTIYSTIPASQSSGGVGLSMICTQETSRRVSSGPSNHDLSVPLPIPLGTYRGRPLAYIPVALNHTAARWSCELLGANLPTLWNATDPITGFQWSLLRASKGRAPTQGVWTGLHSTAGAWQWADGTPAPGTLLLPGGAGSGLCGSIRLEQSDGEVPVEKVIWEGEDCRVQQPFLCHGYDAESRSLPPLPSTIIPRQLSPEDAPQRHEPSPVPPQMGSSAPSWSPESKATQSIFDRHRTVIISIAACAGLVLVAGTCALGYVVWRHRTRLVAPPDPRGVLEIGPTGEEVAPSGDDQRGHCTVWVTQGPEKKGVHQGPLVKGLTSDGSKGQHVPLGTKPVASPALPSFPTATTSSPEPAAGGFTTSGPEPSLIGPSLNPPLHCLGMCVLLAKQIVDSGDLVVANHERCALLINRIRSLGPLLKMLEEKLSGSSQLPEGFQSIFHTLWSTLSQCRSCILQWCEVEGNSLTNILRNMMRAGAYHQEFTFLSESLSAAYDDVHLALSIRSTIKEDLQNHPLRSAGSLGSMEVEDLKALVDIMMTSSEGWRCLSPEEQDLLQQYYQQHNLDLKALIRQAHHRSMHDLVMDLSIPWSQLQLRSQISSGASGAVWRGHWQGHDVAVKVMDQAEVTPRVRKQVRHEAAIMSRLPHPNIAKLYGVVLDPPHCCLVMQYYPRGSLLQLLHDDEVELTWSGRQQICLEVARGMAYLHSRPVNEVVHGDLKSSNVLVGDEGQMILADFGLSLMKTATRTAPLLAPLVSLQYCAPEILNGACPEKTKASDVFAFGVLMYEVASGRLPFSGLDPQVTCHLILTRDLPPPPGPVPMQYLSLMQECCHRDPQARPTFDEIAAALLELEQ